MLRVLSETEFNAIRDKVLASLPAGLSEGDYNRTIGPAMAQAIGEAENSNPTPEGSAAGRFVSGAAEMLNPMGIVHAVAHPIQTVENIGSAAVDQARKAGADYQQGRYLEAAGHGAAAVLPVIGPAAAGAGEQIAAGDVAGGLGKAVGLITPAVAADVVRVGANTAAAVPDGLRASIADRLNASATNRVADVMSPKVGANKVRFGNMAEGAAPKLLENGDVGGAMSRETLHSNVQAGLTEATAALDAATDARLGARSFPTEPVIQDLLKKRAKLTSESVDASQNPRTATSRTSAIVDESGKPIEVTDLKAKALGADVVPGPNAGRVAVIDRAIAELRKLGPVARYEPLRVMRQAYDGPAKAVYNQAMTPDYMKAMGDKLGAADVTGTLRESLAKFDPETAKANADYSLYKASDDVLEATREVERTRPTVGRQIIARMTATATGAKLGGVPGAVGGFVFGPAVDSALSAGFTTKLQTARVLSSLADAVRKGDIGAVTSLQYRLKQLATQAAAVQGSTSPSESQSPTTGLAGARP